MLALYHLCINFSTSNHHNVTILSYNPGNHKTPLKLIQLANYASRIRNAIETGHQCDIWVVLCIFVIYTKYICAQRNKTFILNILYLKLVLLTLHFKLVLLVKTSLVHGKHSDWVSFSEGWPAGGAWNLRRIPSWWLLLETHHISPGTCL